MKLWIARSEIGVIAIYKSKPIKKRNWLTGKIDWHIDNSWGDYMYLQDSLLPEITFENSPQEVELKLVKEE